MLDISIIICTRNRADKLPRLFNSLANLVVKNTINWELLIVNNASTDLTSDVINSEIERKRLPIVLLMQPIPGKSRALNLAITQAKGQLVIFTDDDIETDPTWLQSYFDAAKANPHIDGFAGRVIPKWLGPIPDWLHTEGPYALPRGIINMRDFGSKPILLVEDIIPGGVNTAIRREAIDRTGWFRIELGPGTSVPYTEDTDYMQRYRQFGGQFQYVPDALLYHCNEPERMTKAYICNWMKQVARCQVLAFTTIDLSKTFFDIPYYLLRQFLFRFISWALEPSANKRLTKKMKWMFTFGQILGFTELKEFNKSRSISS